MPIMKKAIQAALFAVAFIAAALAAIDDPMRASENHVSELLAR